MCESLCVCRCGCLYVQVNAGCGSSGDVYLVFGDGSSGGTWGFLIWLAGGQAPWLDLMTFCVCRGLNSVPSPCMQTLLTELPGLSHCVLVFVINAPSTKLLSFGNKRFQRRGQSCSQPRMSAQ